MADALGLVATNLPLGQTLGEHGGGAAVALVELTLVGVQVRADEAEARRPARLNSARERQSVAVEWAEGGVTAFDARSEVSPDGH